jgi:hypothetical protein
MTMGREVTGNADNSNGGNNNTNDDDDMCDGDTMGPLNENI